MSEEAKSAEPQSNSLDDFESRLRAYIVEEFEKACNRPSPDNFTLRDLRLRIAEDFEKESDCSERRFVNIMHTLKDVADRIYKIECALPTEQRFPNRNEFYQQLNAIHHKLGRIEDQLNPSSCLPKQPQRHQATTPDAVDLKFFEDRLTAIEKQQFDAGCAASERRACEENRRYAIRRFIREASIALIGAAGIGVAIWMMK